MPEHKHNSKSLLEKVQLLLLVFGIILFVSSTVTMFQPPHGLRRLRPESVLNYIKNKDFPTVDAVVMQPFIMSEDGATNYSVLSLMRFAPWVRRIHIQDPENKYHPSDHVEYWRTHQRMRIVHFHHDLVEYSVTTPFLADHFFILKPQFLLTNYVFSWQFFVEKSPVLRNCNTGLVPLTRTMLNECCYQRLKPESYYRYALWKALHDGTIQFEDNWDHFVPPCSKGRIASTRQVSTFQEDRVKNYFRFEEPQKNRTKPFQIIMVVVSSPEDDMVYELPEKYQNHVQIWIHLTDLKDQVARLSFIHRMLVCKNIFVEIKASDFDWRSESLGAEIMRRVRKLSEGETFEVTHVFSHGITGTWEQTQANLVGNKLAQTYHSPFSVLTVFQAGKDNMNRTQERERLSFL